MSEPRHIHLDRGDGYTLCGQRTKTRPYHVTSWMKDATCGKCRKEARLRRAFRLMCRREVVEASVSMSEDKPRE